MSRVAQISSPVTATKAGWPAVGVIQLRVTVSNSEQVADGVLKYTRFRGRSILLMLSFKLFTKDVLDKLGRIVRISESLAACLIEVLYSCNKM